MYAIRIGSQVGCPNMTDVDGSGMGVSSSSVTSAVVPFSSTVIRVDVSCVLHPFSLHKLDAGPIRLVTIAHAFNYRMAVLRDGVKSAIWVGRSRKAEGRFLTDTDLSWGSTGGRHVSNNIDPDVEGAVLFGGNGWITGCVS